MSIDVVDEGKKGLLGIGGREAKVKVTVKPKKKRSGDGQRTGNQQEQLGPEGLKWQLSQAEKAESSPVAVSVGTSRRTGQRKPAASIKRCAATKKKVAVDKKPEDEARTSRSRPQVAREFTEGLLEAFGLEGEVATRVEDDILFIDINGEQTEALVGRKGAVVQAVHELTRTVIQRKTFGAPRMRLDIAGYGARRRRGAKDLRWPSCRKRQGRWARGHVGADERGRSQGRPRCHRRDRRCSFFLRG